MLLSAGSPGTPLFRFAGLWLTVSLRMTPSSGNTASTNRYLRCVSFLHLYFSHIARSHEGNEVLFHLMPDTSPCRTLLYSSMTISYHSVVNRVYAASFQIATRSPSRCRSFGRQVPQDPIRHCPKRQCSDRFRSLAFGFAAPVLPLIRCRNRWPPPPHNFLARI